MTQYFIVCGSVAKSIGQEGNRQRTWNCFLASACVLEDVEERLPSWHLTQEGPGNCSQKIPKRPLPDLWMKMHDARACAGTSFTRHFTCYGIPSKLPLREMVSLGELALLTWHQQITLFSWENLKLIWCPTPQANRPLWVELHFYFVENSRGIYIYIKHVKYIICMMFCMLKWCHFGYWSKQIKFIKLNGVISPDLS